MMKQDSFLEDNQWATDKPVSSSPPSETFVLPVQKPPPLRNGSFAVFSDSRTGTPSPTQSRSSSVYYQNNSAANASLHQAKATLDQEVFTAKRAALLQLISKSKSLLDSLTSLSPIDAPKKSIPIRQQSTIGARVLDDLSDTQKVVTHLSNLYTRIADTKSRVLVTGDLNSGKSTFINALLHRQVVPDDQQPCTALFCEVSSVDQNNGVEEVHGITTAETYSIENTDSYKKLNIDDIRDIVELNEDQYEIVKVYCKDSRPDGQSLLRNGVVDISLIDSPGLNIDMMKTFALFSKQETIDVIVFVVNAENHFTLSGREFLSLAGKEKAYIFIVVNKFDSIRRKDRCMKDILSQIKEISPETYKERDTLIHFVSAKQRLQTYLASLDPTVQPLSEQQAGTTINDFINLEECLRSFIFEKRMRSKLAPAKHYLINLMSDLDAIAATQEHIWKSKKDGVEHQLMEESPKYKLMQQMKEEWLDTFEDKMIQPTIQKIEKAVEGQLLQFLQSIDTVAENVTWTGILGVWGYTQKLRGKISEVALKRQQVCENFAKHKSLECIMKLEEHLKGLEPPISIDYKIIEEGFSEKKYAVQVEEVLEYQDKVEIVKEYVPSLMMLGAGLIGYNSVVMRGVRNNLMSQTKMIFAGLSIAGVGLFLYVLSDMKTNVDKKVVSKMKQQFIETKYVESTVSRISTATQRILKVAFWEVQNQFGKLVKESTSRRDEMLGIARESERNLAMLRRARDDVKNVKEEVEGVDLEE